jgi:integrase
MARRRAAPAVDPVTQKPLPEGVWYRGPRQYLARKVVNGRRVAVTFEKASDAARWLREAQVDKDRGVFIDRTMADRTSVRSLLERYRANESPKKRGATQEIGHISVIEADDLALIKVGRLMSEDVVEWRERMVAASYAPATIVRRMNLLQTIINHACSEWSVKLSSNPVKGVNRPPGADKKRERVFRDADEEAAVLAACDADTNPWLGRIVRWALATAMRQGECVSIHRDKDLIGSVCIVRGLSGEGTKNEEIREVPLFDDALTILDQVRRLPKPICGRLFPIDQNILKMRFRRAMARAGVEDFTFHDLRHEATGRLAERFPNPLDLALITGHKDLKSLKRYYNVGGEDLLKRAVGRPGSAPS